MLVMVWSRWRWFQRKRRDEGDIIAREESPALDWANGWLDGRLHLTNVPYPLPVDEQEINRLDFQHYLLRSAQNVNYLAPVVEPGTILDVGCAGGRWVYEVALQFPQASVIGFDMAPSIFQTTSIPFPGNCGFVYGNLLQGLPFEAASFDFVHQRLLALAIPQATWPAIVNELVRVTRPWGWIELAEIDYSLLRVGAATAQLLTWILEVCRHLGLDMGVAERLGLLLQEAGLTHIGMHTLSIPLGAYGGRLGSLAQANFEKVAEALRPIICASLGVSTNEYRYVLHSIPAECEHYHTQMLFRSAWGQRNEKNTPIPELWEGIEI
jgi:SAM-dependent methyltransferase